MVSEFKTLYYDYLLDLMKNKIICKTSKEFVAFYEGYKDLDDADKEILKATLDAFVS